MKVLFHCLLVVAVSFEGGRSAFAQSPPDKSGVRPSVISLPTGAGSIEGLGESFEPQLNTGGSSYGIAIAVVPGRANLTPKLRLGYDSYAGNGLAGIGWSLDLPSIKRQTDKGFPEYDSGDTFIFGGEELVPLNNTGGDWRVENEREFKRLRQIDSDADGLVDAWEVTDRDGTRHTFGRHRGQGGRWSVVENPELSGRPAFDRTYCWMLDSTTDVHGNRIEYEYTPGSGVIYPSRVSYGHFSGNVHEVLFQYEPRPDAFDDYRPTFSARLDQRLSRIEVRSRGQLVRAYNLSYSYGAGDLTPEQVALQSTYLDLGVTLLKRVVQVDRSGSDANFLPPLIFAYTGLDLTKADHRGFVAPPELDLAEPNGRVQLADLDGDALPDLFSTPIEGAGMAQRVCLNRGETKVGGVPKMMFAPSRLAQASSPVDLALPNAVVHDPKGKGLVDISSLIQDGPNKRLETFGNRSRLDLLNEERLGFSQTDVQSTVIENPPAFVSYSEAGTRQMDVNFDKRGDFVNLEQSFGSMKVNSFYQARDGVWTIRETMLPPTYPLANTFSNTNGEPNPCVHLADMNGDRLLDLLCLRVNNSGGGQRISVSYWPLSGLGRYSEERTLTNSVGDAFDIGSLDLRDVFVEDFTGDGLSDVLVLDGSGPETTLILRVNVAGQRWSSPYIRTGLPRYAPRDPNSPTVLRMADLNANGSLDLIFRNTAPANTISYVELLPTGRPSILNGIDNSLGKRTTIVYGTAAEDEQRARESGHPWRTLAPFALEVVRQIRVSCGQDLNGDGREDTAVAEFRYRDPFYDGYEREFRGFSFAQRIDYGDDFLFDSVTGLMNVSTNWNRSRTPTGQVSGPSLVTRFRFHTGSADQTDNDDYGSDVPAFRLIDEFTEAAGHEEEPLKGMQFVEEKVDPVVLHFAIDGDFDSGCEAASTATSLEGASRLTPDAYVYTRSTQDWKIRRLYRPGEELPYFADQDADGLYEDYRTAPVAPIPAGRFASQGIQVLPENGRSVSFAFAREKITEVREANGLLSSTLGYPAASFVRTMQNFDYDDYGNQTLNQDWGVDGSGYDDERFTLSTYALGGNALSLWIINKPDVVEVTDENGAFVSKKTHFYDGAPFVGVQGQIQNRGLLSRTLENIDANRSIESARSQYDAFGNLIETRDPVGNRRTFAWDALFQCYPVTETIIVGGGSPNLVLTASYDTAFGVVTNSVDFNGQVTTYQFDSFARLVGIVRPADSAALPTQVFEYQPADPIRGKAFVYDTAGHLTQTPVPIGSMSRVTTRRREISGQPGQYLTAEFTDGCGKALASIQEGETAGTWIVSKATSYNLRLQNQSEWQAYQIASVDVPQFTALWPAGRPPVSDGVNPAIVSTDRYFDPMGREIRTVNPPETWGGTRSETATQYLPFQKRLFDEEDLRVGSGHFATPNVQSFDGLNRMTAVEELVRLTDAGEAGALTTWRTEYRYDLNDQILRTQDSQGNVKLMGYDGLKRMTNMNDPDRGRMTFTYDDASNLRETIDARSQHTVYTYDGANRIKTEDYQDGGPRQFDVEYNYDVPLSGLDLGDGTTGTASNVKGQLAWVRDLSGEMHFSYDARSRKEWEVKRMADAVHGQLVSYRTRFSFDANDRLERLTYPDGDEVAHAYNSRNLLTRIFGAVLGDVVTTVRYKPSGQFASIRYGNQVGTSYAFDPRLRLTDLETTNGATRLIDFAYSFDAASNVQQIDDQRSLSGTPDAAKRFNTQVFSYDDLYRLTRVGYPVMGTTVTNRVDYRYDRIGNMLTQTSDLAQTQDGVPLANLGVMTSGGATGRFNRQGRNPGEAPGPHALTQISGNGGSRDFSYDANGNLIIGDGVTNTWDFKDRLVRVESDLMVAAYAYDYMDRRVTKTVHWKQPAPDQGILPSELNPAWRKTTTLYINEYFEVREHEAPVKYVWHDQTRVARVTGLFGGSRRIQPLRLQAGWNLWCLRVGGTFPQLDPANNPDIGACAYWSGTGPDNGYVQVTASTVIPAGAVVRVFGRRALTLVLAGAPAPATLAGITSAGHFFGNLLARPLDLTTDFPTNAWISIFDPMGSMWRQRFPKDTALQSVNERSTVLAPGQAAWIKGVTTATVSNNPAADILYYHQDHLGSSACLADRSGAIVTEMAYYPFGESRNVWPSSAPAKGNYQFTQKEADRETSLKYFEKRFLLPIARFLSTDSYFACIPRPPYLTTSRPTYTSPNDLNLYAYCNNNPLRKTDRTGLAPGDLYTTSDAAASDAMTAANAKSIPDNKEYGGLICKGPNNTFQATTPTSGSGTGFNPSSVSCPTGERVGDYHTHGNYSLIGASGPVATGDPTRDDYDSDNFSTTDLDGIRDDAVKRAAPALAAQFLNPVANPDLKQDYKGYVGTPSGTFKYYAPFTGVRANLVVDPTKYRYTPPASKSP
jgi:RHS repeat-associated protein